MKILFYANNNIQTPNGFGIQKKINAQARALRGLGHEVWHYGFLSSTEGQGACVDKGDGPKLIYPINYLSIFGLYAMQVKFAKLIRKEKFDISYIRPPRISPWTLFFLKTVKKCSSRVIVEIPSYPYEREYWDRGWYFRTELIIDVVSRFFLRFFVDRIVTFSRYKRLFSIPVKTISNGADPRDALFLPQPKLEGELILVALATLTYSQAYDRVIKGLAEWEPRSDDPDVLFRVIGVGDQMDLLQSLNCNLPSKCRVEFLGNLSGDELEVALADAHIGVAGLGKHRLNITSLSTIKVPEYSLRGLPFIIGYDDVGIPKAFPWAFNVPADETPININAVLDYYKVLTADLNHRECLNRYAIENLTWEKQMANAISDDQ